MPNKPNKAHANKNRCDAFEDDSEEGCVEEVKKIAYQINAPKNGAAHKKRK